MNGGMVWKCMNMHVRHWKTELGGERGGGGEERSVRGEQKLHMHLSVL